MWKFLLTLAVGAMVVITVLQQQRIAGLSEQVDQYRSRLQELESTVAGKEDTVKLLYRFIVNNHKRLRNYNRHMLLTATAYSARSQETDDTPRLTASNSRVRPGIVAISRDLFDMGWVFGKKVYVQDLGVFTIDDLMHSRKTKQIDIYMEETQEALVFGRKKLNVFLLDADPALEEKAAAEEHAEAESE